MSVDAWVNQVVPRMAGAPTEFVRAEVVRVMKDFCSRTTAWRQMTRGIDIVAGQREITIPTDDPQALHSGVLRVYFRGQRMSDFSHAPWEYETDEPMGYTALPGPPLVLMLMTIPSRTITGELDVLTYDVPADPINAGVPGILSGEFFDAIFNGVLGSLYSADSKPYSNATLSKLHLSKYESAISKARARASSGFTATAQGWVFPRFGV